MAETPANPIVLDSFEKDHLKKLAALENKVAALYSELAKEVGVIGSLYGGKVDLEKVFKLSDYPDIAKKVDDLVVQLKDKLNYVIVDGVKAQWQLANEKNDDLVHKVFGEALDSLPEEKLRKYFTTNDAALESFLKRKDKGLGLSQKVWKYAQESKVDIESALELGIKSGQSASSMARDLKQYLKEPNKLFRRVRDKEGKLHLSKAAQAYHPGQGVYRSSYKNALRLAVTEANMAYRASDHERWQAFDFVVGIEVRLSNNHTLNGKPFYDICDELKGKYPKDFKFSGWHPFCYSKDSEVLTTQGWKLFKDVSYSDTIISLNPDTREVECVGITDMQKYWYDGLMYRFYNKTLDCLVTPEHRMVYLNKSDGEIRYCEAKDYTKGKGGFYRAAKNNTADREKIDIRGNEYDFDAFCEFMGYWLSDGSLEHNSGVSVSQNIGEKAREDIIDCIKKLGFEPKLRNDKVLFYSSRFNSYLKQFGYSFTKYIPQEIIGASARQIKVFLDAFVKCDGYTRPCKSFVGNHGNVFQSENEERMYFTTSPRMAGELCQCLLKIGHRPSVTKTEPQYAIKKDGRVICGNKPHYAIRECGSATSTVFDKETVEYSDYVYDLTLERNHIMYIKRNGKCFWGSNCRCHAVSILKTREELMADNQRILDGQEPVEESKNSVDDLPPQYKKWVADNKSRILAADQRGTLPYFITDNAFSTNKLLGKPLDSVKVPLWYAHNKEVQDVQKQLKEIKQWTLEHPKAKKFVGQINGVEAAISNGASIEDILAQFDVLNHDYKFRVSHDAYLARKKAEAIVKKPTALEIAKKRHEARTPEQIDSIKLAWGKRQIRTINEAIDSGLLPQEVFSSTGELYMLLKEKNYAAFNQKIAPLQKAAARHKARTPETIKVIKDAWAKRAEEILKDEQFLSALIPDVKKWKKQFSSKKLHEVYDAVEKKLAQIGSASSLKDQLHSLEFEMNWVMSQKKYSTWEVAHASYDKARKGIIFKIDVEVARQRTYNIVDFLAKNQDSTRVAALYDDIINALNKGNLNKANTLIDKAYVEIDDYIQQQLKIAMQNLQNVPPELEEYIAKHYTTEFTVYDQDSYDRVMQGLGRSTKDAWQNATEEARKAFPYYTDSSSHSKRILTNVGLGKKEPYADLLDSILNNITTEEDLVLRSGQNYDVAEYVFGSDFRKLLEAGEIDELNKLSGTIGVNKAYMSTSFNKNGGFSKEFEVHIFAPKGTHCINLNEVSTFGNGKGITWDGESYAPKWHDGGETEIFLHRGYKWRFVKAEAGAGMGGRTRIYVQLLDRIELKN